MDSWSPEASFPLFSDNLTQRTHEIVTHNQNQMGSSDLELFSSPPYSVGFVNVLWLSHSVLRKVVLTHNYPKHPSKEAKPFHLHILLEKTTYDRLI